MELELLLTKVRGKYSDEASYEATRFNVTLIISKYYAITYIFSTFLKSYRT